MPMLRRRKGEKKTQQAVRTEMTAMKAGKLHSGSKTGPRVTNPKQAVAIGLSEARKSGAKMPTARNKVAFAHPKAGGPKPPALAAQKRLPAPKKKAVKRGKP